MLVVVLVLNPALATGSFPLSTGKGCPVERGGVWACCHGCVKNYPGGVPRHPFLERRGVPACATITRKNNEHTNPVLVPPHHPLATNTFTYTNKDKTQQLDKTQNFG